MARQMRGKPRWGLVLALAVFFLALSTAVSAAIGCGDTNNICIVTGTNTTDANFIDGNTYVLVGSVLFSGADVDLNIAPRAVVKYFVSTSSGLTITSNARIIADGNSTNKIFFTTCRDQTVGGNTSIVSGCTGAPGGQDYNTALYITSSSGMTSTDSLSFLEVRHATIAVQLEEGLSQIRDSNFFLGRRTTTSQALYLPNSQDTNLVRNSFDVNANGTTSGYYAIRADANYSGEIRDSNITVTRGAYGIHVQTGSFRGKIYDNNIFVAFTTVVGYGISLFSIGPHDGNIYRNRIDVNTNALVTYGVRINGDYSGSIYDNNISIRGGGASATAIRIDAGILSGSIYDNNFWLDRSHGIYDSNTIAVASANIYRNKFDLNANATAYYPIYFAFDFSGNINDNNIIIKGAGGFAIRFNAGTVSGQVYNNDFNLDRSYAIYSYTSSAYSGNIYSNRFDINFGSAAYYGIFLNSAYSGQIYDNNFALKQGGYGVFVNAGAFSGIIHDNNFWLDRSFAVYHNPATAFSGDINNNRFTSLTNLATSYIFNLQNGSGSFTGSICNNDMNMIKSTYLIYVVNGTFSGNFCKNRIFDVNQTAGFYIRNAGTFSGSIYDNNISRITHWTATSYFLYNTGTFSGTIHDNNIADINNVGNTYFFTNAATFTGNIYDNNITGMTNSSTTSLNMIFYSSSTFSGNIYRNRVNMVRNFGATSLIYNASAFSGSIFDNNFSAISGTAASYLFQHLSNTFSGNFYGNTVSNVTGTNYIIGVTGGTFSGQIYSNHFKDINTTATYAVIYNNAAMTGNVHDNNFFNLTNVRVITQGTAGSLDGNFYQNDINNVWYASANQVFNITGAVSGSFYNNKFKDSNNGTVLYFAGTTFSGNVYNNLFARLSMNTTYFIQNAGTTFSGSVYNNTFFAFNAGAANAAITNSLTFSGNIQRNLFLNGRIGLNGTYTGTVSYNAFQGVSTVGGTASQHAGDQNSATGFTVNPFIGDNSDRNFLLNTDANGGAKLVDAGGADTTSFFQSRTTRLNNKLDTNQIDIGYHYDQNAPFVLVVSPNGGETVSGTSTIDFNFESGFGTTGTLTATLAYSAAQTGGTQITSSALSSFSCSSGPIFVCSYSWDASNVSDGNYFIVLTGTDTNGSGTDSSDNNFFVLSVPRVLLKTYLGTKPRSFFGFGQDVNIIVDGNAGTPLITITDSDGNVRVNQQSMTSTPTSDTNRSQYTYNVDGNIGWYTVRISGKTVSNAFYRAKLWSDGYTDLDGNVFPFQFDLNVREPNFGQRWFWLIEKSVDFNYLAKASAVRVLDYNGGSFLEIPSQLYDQNASGSSIIGGKIVFLVSLDKNETRTFFVNYARSERTVSYPADLNLSIADFNYSFENSLLKTEIDLNLGGMVSRAWSKRGSNANLGGYSPMQLSPEVKSGIYTYDSSAVTNPGYSLDVNGGLYSRLNATGISGGLDYNVTYYFYAKQPYFFVDMNVKPAQNQTWNYLYDDYLVLGNGSFTKFGYFLNNDLNTFDVNAGDGTDRTSIGDINYWGVYNQTTGNGMGSIFLYRFSSPTPSISTNFYDESAYEYWTRQVYSGSVTTSQQFNTRIARSIFNSWAETVDLNRQYYEFRNPPVFSIGGTHTNDSSSPIVLDYNRTPFDANDVADLNIWVVTGDNLQIDFVDINIFGSDLNIQTRQTFTDANATPNYTVNANILNAGTVDANFLITDIAANSTLRNQNFSVSDKTAPAAWKLSVTPDTNAAIDPNTRVRFDANITEYSSVSSVNLLIRWYYDNNSNWSDWNTIAMNLVNQPSDYNYNYDLNYLVPTDLNKRFEYKVYTRDSNNNDANSDSNFFYALTDYTWEFYPTTFADKNGSLDTNVTIGDLNIVNTGDVSLSFTISSNWDLRTKVFYNDTPEGTGYSITVPVDSNGKLSTQITTKTTERSDSLTVTATPTDSRASPSSRTSTGTVFSLAGGPFMYVEIPTYESSVTQGDNNKSFSARVTNRGNQDANTADLNWTLPTGWSITTGSASASAAPLAVGQTLTNSIVVSIATTASTGTQSVTATAGADGNTSKTRSTSVDVVVVALDTNEGGSTTIITVGGSSGGGGGGGGNSIFSTSEEKTFFQTTEKFELIRGRDQKFNVKIKNPFKNQVLKNLVANVSGLLSKYLQIENPEIGDLQPNEEKTVVVKITAPKYFILGSHKIVFTVSGILLPKKGSTAKEVAFTYEKEVTLVIRELDKPTALRLVNEATKKIQELEALGINVLPLRELLREAKGFLVGEEFEKTKGATEQILYLAEIAVAVQQQLKELESMVKKSELEGIETPRTNRLLVLAQLSFQRGEFQKAQDVTKDALLTYSLETKGAFNIGYFLLQNNKEIGLGIVLLMAMAFIMRLYLKRAMLHRRFRLLEAEEALLLNLIKELQDQCFIQKKIGMNEYYTALSQYESKLSKTVENTIQTENQLANLLRLKTTATKLREEREAILLVLKKTQSQYFKEGLIETRLYQAKQTSLVKRLNEIEKDITYNEAKKSIRQNTGMLKHFWQAYYKTIK